MVLAMISFLLVLQTSAGSSQPTGRTTEAVWVESIESSFGSAFASVRSESGNKYRISFDRSKQRLKVGERILIEVTEDGKAMVIADRWSPWGDLSFVLIVLVPILVILAIFLPIRARTG